MEISLSLNSLTYKEWLQQSIKGGTVHTTIREPVVEPQNAHNISQRDAACSIVPVLFRVVMLRNAPTTFLPFRVDI